MKLFWHGSDYNLILEKILDSKYFSSNSKSLLLSMIYKLEGFYEDYQTVKNIDTTKDEFLNLVLDTIKKYCDNVKLIEPEDAEILKKNNVLAVTNEKERSILCYPREDALLYAIADVMPKYFYVSSSFEYKNSLQRTLVNGYNANMLEILSDFNGWSWDSNIKQKKYFQDYLIYQNFVIVFGNSFMEEWRGKKTKDFDYWNEIQKYFAKTKYIEFLCKYLVFGLTAKEKTKTNKELEAKIKELEKISDKITYFEEIKITKLKYLKELEKITLSLNNKDLMRKEYMNKNKKLSAEKRIATLGTYKKMLEARKEKIVNKISVLTSRMNPINYMNYKRELEKFIEINSKEEENQDEIMVNLQKEFIKAISDTCFETEDVQSLKNLVFKLRYYRFLYVTSEKQVRDIPELNDEINQVMKQVIQKLVLNTEIKRIAKDNTLNQEIIFDILDTKVIDLESVRFEMDIKEDCIQFKTYEKEVFEKEFEIDGNFSRRNLEIKQKKIYKLFI
ncbi:MAG: hypothetical protein IJ629_05985 [Clostridia bacterium]|nr:hypothetical protein [Clostridia bacterium]